VVVHGARRGARLGFPTVNLHPDNELSPADGIYAAQVRLTEGGWCPAAASIGFNPTFGGGTRTLEAFILDFDGDTYGARLRLRLCRKLRDQAAFPSPEALRAAIAADVEAVRAFFADTFPGESDAAP
jgi:riboflavin kinase/FMN adenylyltransferase